MDFQTIIVAVIVFAACLYVGRIVWNKVKSASKNSACDSGCGCGAKAESKNVFTQIKRG